MGPDLRGRDAQGGCPTPARSVQKDAMTNPIDSLCRHSRALRHKAGHCLLDTGNCGNLEPVHERA